MMPALFRRPVALSLAGCAALLTACSPFTKVTGDEKTVAKIDGSWTVRYVGGKEIDPALKPELSFDTAKGTVTGFDGCNRLNGSFTFDAGLLKAKTASTRMACPNDAARQASQAMNDLLANQAEVVEVAMGQGRVLLMKNASSELRLVPSQYAK